MNKQDWLLSQIKKFPVLSARELTARLNDKKLVDNPKPQEQLPVLPTLKEALSIVTPEEAFNVSETNTYDRILESFNIKDFEGVKNYLFVLKSGGILSDTSYNLLIELLDKTEPDPNYKKEVWISEAELAGFGIVLVNEVEDLK